MLSQALASWVLASWALVARAWTKPLALASQPCVPGWWWTQKYGEMYVQIYGQTSYPLHYTGDSPFGAVAKIGVVEKEGRSGKVEWIAVLCP